MHNIQEKLIALSHKHDLKKMGFRKIGRLISEEHPQKIKHHLEQLEKKGLLEKKQKLQPGRKKRILVGNIDIASIPILGFADCGDPTAVAEGRIEGHLQISKRLLPVQNREGVFALRAIGESMNQAEIGIDKKNIRSGDYVLINCKNRSPENESYILSIINGMASIKKIVFDKKNQQIVLCSESSVHFPPIHIHEKDYSDYMVGGKVIGVIKNPPSEDIEYIPEL